MNELNFADCVNWEWVHAHHPKSAGKVIKGAWLRRIIAHAKRNGYSGRITSTGAQRIVNSRLY